MVAVEGTTETVMPPLPLVLVPNWIVRLVPV
jgi:hypothetical protein